MNATRKKNEVNSRPAGALWVLGLRRHITAEPDEEQVAKKEKQISKKPKQASSKWK